MSLSQNPRRFRAWRHLWIDIARYFVYTIVRFFDLSCATPPVERVGGVFSDVFLKQEGENGGGSQACGGKGGDKERTSCILMTIWAVCLSTTADRSPAVGMRGESSPPEIRSSSLPSSSLELFADSIIVSALVDSRCCCCTIFTAFDLFRERLSFSSFRRLDGPDLVSLSGPRIGGSCTFIGSYTYMILPSIAVAVCAPRRTLSSYY